MRIKSNDNKLYLNKNSSPISFNGRGTDYINNWVKNDGTRLNWFKDIVADISEGANLYFKKNKEIDNNILGFHAGGGLTVYFDIPNNEILKVSLENPLEFRKHQPEFDIPFLTPVEKYGKTYIVKQPKADVKNITDEHFLDVAKRIYHNKCELSKDGYKYEQYGLYNGKPYLIDTRCAKPKPNNWTLFVNWLCKKLPTQVVFITKEQDELERELAYKAKGYLSYHCDETPDKSLTFKGGLLKLFYKIKNCIKYRKQHYSIPYEVSRLQQNKISKYYKK